MVEIYLASFVGAALRTDSRMKQEVTQKVPPRRGTLSAEVSNCHCYFGMTVAAAFEKETNNLSW